MATIGNNIKRVRSELGLTQEEVGRKVGISRSYLSDLENRNKSISSNMLLRLAKKLDVPVNKFINDSTDLNKE